MGARPEPDEQAELYSRWLWRGGVLADASKKAYEARVREFVSWVLEHGEQYADAFTDEYVRDYAARDYRRKLLTVDKKAPATVSQAMSALGSFYEWLELGKPQGVRVEVVESERKGLVEEDLRKLLRACQRRGPRDHAIAATLYYAAPRVGELVALDVDDVHTTERKGQLHIRYGKGGKPRKVPLSKEVRPVLDLWKKERGTWPGAADTPALFLSKQGGRLSARTVEHVLHEAGESVGVKVSPHNLRHSFGRQHAEAGTDLESLRQMMGHKNIATTAGYTRPRWEDLEDAVDRIGVDI